MIFSKFHLCIRLWKEGKPLYELARKGIEIEREARPVTIYALELIEFTENSITLDVTCSKGTYIRVLGEDIGEAIGCGGHLTMLNRLKQDILSLYRVIPLNIWKV